MDWQEWRKPNRNGVARSWQQSGEASGVFGPEFEHFPDTFRSALQHNDPVEQETMQLARNFRPEPVRLLKETKRQLHDLDTQIRHLLEKKEYLEREASRHLKQIQGCDAVVSPFRRLPLDILSEIAAQAIPQYPTPSKNQAPLSLSLTCSLWRNAVLSTPSLWQTLYISAKDCESLEISSRRVNTWCKRAKALKTALFIFLDFEFELNDAQPPSTDIIHFLLDIANILPRVRHLGLGCQYLEHLLPYLDVIPPWRLDNLHTLDFIHKYGDQDREVSVGIPEPFPVVTLPSFTRNSHTLRRIRIENVFASDPRAKDMLPWCQLTHLNLHESLREHQFDEVLRWCPNLEDGVFHVHPFEFGATPATRSGRPKTVHHNLRELAICFTTFCERVVELLAPWVLPELERLDVSSDRWGNLSPSDEVVTPEAELTNFPNLRMLAVDETYSDRAEHLVSLLSLSTGLKELVIIRPNSNFNAVFKAISHNSKFLPKLSNLHIEDASYNSFDTVLFSNAIAARRHNSFASDPNSCAILRTLSISGYRAFQPAGDSSLEELLQPCVTSGLTLYLNSRTRLAFVNKFERKVYNGWVPPDLD